MHHKIVRLISLVHRRDVIQRRRIFSMQIVVGAYIEALFMF